MLTSAQLQLLQIARRDVAKASAGAFDEAQWRLVLRNVGRALPDADGRVSAKSLTHAGFEGVMAFCESTGFRDRTPGRGPDYWRSRDASRTGLATSRQVFAIQSLYARYAGRTAKPVSLSGIVMRASQGYHTDPRQLTPALAARVIEALNAILDRAPAGQEQNAPAVDPSPQDAASDPDPEVA